MNYKRLIRSRSVRIKILAILSWIPDRIMIPLQYKIHTGRKLNLNNPKRFTEKLQIYKLKYRNPLMLRCTDKYEVRKVIEEWGFKEFLIPLIGIYDSVNQINFDELPDQFVAKTTDGGGGNQVHVCRNKHELSIDEFNNQLLQWMSAPKSKKTGGREWAYENDYPRRIIIETLISDGNNIDLPDYKFYCFNGKPLYCQVISSRTTKETIDFFDMNWVHQPFVGLNPECKNAPITQVKPPLFDQMVSLAKKLSKDFPFVRVDLYNDGTNIYFGELTFYPASGYGRFSPDVYDAKLGELLNIEHF